jgi:CAAX protease family protein
VDDPRPWPAWSAPVALVVGVVVAAVGGVIVDIPAAAAGVSITSSHTPPGITLADTFVQDVGFILAAVFCGHLGGRTVRSWQLGLRSPQVRMRTVALMVVGLLVAFVLLDEAWVALVHPGEDKILEQLGSSHSGLLLVLSAAITCIVAPICEEILFRGYIFTALRSRVPTLWAALLTGALFGGVHAGSAPALDLLPLALLGFGLCLLYRGTGSLYPCFAVHSLNNTLAFASLENFNVGEWALLFVCSWAGIALLVRAARRVGLIAAPPAFVASDA